MIHVTVRIFPRRRVPSGPRAWAPELNSTHAIVTASAEFDEAPQIGDVLRDLASYAPTLIGYSDGVVRAREHRREWLGNAGWGRARLTITVDAFELPSEDKP